MFRFSAALGVAIAMVAASEPASAQDSLEVGAGTLVMPAHLGAEDHRLIVLPTIDVRQGRLFANMVDGAGADVDVGPITLGAAINYVIGYRTRDVPSGIGRLSDGVAARAFVRGSLGGTIITIGANKGISGGTGGWTGDATVLHPIPVSDRLVVAPTAAVAWADRRHNRRYFGVDSVQSASSGLRPHVAGGGFTSLSAGANARYSLTKRLAITATGRAYRLLPAVTDSPIVQRRTAMTAFIGLSYRL